MRCNSLLPLLLIAGFLGGCVRTIQPILNDDQVIADNSLVGKWSATDDKSFFEVEAADDQKVCKVTYTDKEGKIAPLIARLGKIGEITVAELRADEPAPDSSDVYKAHLLRLYSFLVIRATKPDFKFAIMGQDWLKKYLADHPNDLRVAASDRDNMVVTSSTADFQTFLLHHFKDKGALSEEASYVRAPAPTTQPPANRQSQ